MAWEEVVMPSHRATTPLQNKSTTAQIRERFDNDVARFSKLDTGQVATIDAPLVMELVALAAAATAHPIGRVLDVGCGAGNYTIKLRQHVGHDFHADLLDLSIPMLDRAVERVSAINGGPTVAIHGDFRDVALPAGAYDVIVAAAVFHHLRDDADWLAAFKKLHEILAPGGSVWIADLVAHEVDAVQDMMWTRYGDYLAAVGGSDYRDEVFAYIDQEDSPRPVTYQLDLLRSVGFSRVELLHKHSCFAAFGAVKGG